MVSPRNCSSVRRRGIAAVELALLLPFLAFLFVIAVDFSRVFFYSVTVTNCARNGAVYAYIDKAHALDSAGIEAAAKKDAANFSPVTVTSTPDNNIDPKYVDVSVTYLFTTITKYPGVPSSLTLKRTVRAEVVPQLPDY
jgi:Flp pilus assembly protein TadG